MGRRAGQWGGVQVCGAACSSRGMLRNYKLGASSLADDSFESDLLGFVIVGTEGQQGACMQQE